MTERSILIVEDEPIVQLHLQLIVADAGHRVCATVSTAQEAFDAADRNPPDLVLMDIRLKGDMDGVAAARILSDTYDCSVIFTTAHSDPETLARTREVGPSAYITKPFTNAEVRAAISTAFANHDRLKAAEQRSHSLVSILRSLDEGILTTNAQGAISFWNTRASQLTGWDANDSMGRDLFEVVRFARASDTEAFRSAAASSLSKGKPHSLTSVTIVERDGTARGVSIDVETTLDHTGQASGLVVTLRERSESRRFVTTANPIKTQFGRGTRMLVYSHDTFGLGHLHRCSNLIRALLDRNPGLSVLLVTGSSVAHRFELPAGADYVKLPAVRKVGSDRYEARSLAMPDSGVMTLRSNLLLRTVRDYDPNVLLVDHSPVGMNDELLPTLEMLQRRGGCTTLLGLRDIIDDPAAVVRLWKEKRIYDVLRNLYDHVLVYGAQSVYDTVKAYEFPDDVAAKTFFAHYVCDTREPDEDPEAAPHEGLEPLVVVSIGGGDGGADAVIGTYLDMLEQFRSQISFRSEIVCGPLLPVDARERFQKRALGLPVSVREFVPSTTPLFRAADLVVSTGGYNTVTQLLSHARRALIIPRVLHRQEQLIRARNLAELGLVGCIHPRDIDAQKMFDAIQSALAADVQPLSQARELGVPPLDGAERVAEFCSRLLVSGPQPERDTP